MTDTQNAPKINAAASAELANLAYNTATLNKGDNVGNSNNHLTGWSVYDVHDNSANGGDVSVTFINHQSNIVYTASRGTDLNNHAIVDLHTDGNLADPTVNKNNPQ